MRLDLRRFQVTSYQADDFHRGNEQRRVEFVRFSRLPVHMIFPESRWSAASKTSVPARHVRPKAGERVLDIGCVQAPFWDPCLQSAMSVRPECALVAIARKNFRERGTFVWRCSRVTGRRGRSVRHCACYGVLHHSTTNTRCRYRIVASLAERGGRLITIDPVSQTDSIPGALAYQSTETERPHRVCLASLMRQRFQRVETTVRGIPAHTIYTLIAQCIRDVLPSGSSLSLDAQQNDCAGLLSSSG